MIALSPQELEVLRRRYQGDEVKQIAADLDLSTSSVAEYQSRALVKLGLGSLERLLAVGKIFEAFRQTDAASRPTLSRRMTSRQVAALRAYATTQRRAADLVDDILDGIAEELENDR